MSEASVKGDDKRATERREAREFALKFLYQNEMDKIFFFSENHFSSFNQHFPVSSSALAFSRELLERLYKNWTEIDKHIQDHAKNWSISRMSVIDRSILRLALAEMLGKETPYKVVINEAIEIGKLYGSGESSAFINGILDAVSVKLK